MDLRQLEHFVAVADERNFTRAAKRVHIVQSALSTSIRALEIELGAQLFARSTRHVTLTAVGGAFYERAMAVLASVRAARDAVAIAPLFEPLPEVVTTFITCEPLVLACASDHPLAGLTEVPLARLAKEPFVDFLLDWGTRRMVDRAFEQVGVERRTTFEVSDLQTMSDLVARGLGIALLPEALVAARTGPDRPHPLGMARLAGPEICWELVAAYPGKDATTDLPNNPAARAFVQMVQDLEVLGA